MRRRVVSGLFALLSGCGTITALSKIEQPATIVLGGSTSVIVAPDTVARGSTFEIRFTSYENKCTDPLRDDLDVRGDSILVRPVVTRARECGDALLIFDHRIHVNPINTAGKYRIFLYGRRDGFDGYVVITRDLVIR
jgi:hypothetical protein